MARQLLEGDRLSYSNGDLKLNEKNFFKQHIKYEGDEKLLSTLFGFLAMLKN